MKALLDFQLAGHDQFLSKFRSLFREVDANGDGVLSEEEFKQLVAIVDPTKVRACTGVRVMGGATHAAAADERAVQRPAEESGPVQQPEHHVLGGEPVP